MVADCNSRYNWIFSGNGAVLPNAIPGGISSSGEVLYIGRVNHEGKLICGKIHPSYQCLFVPDGGKEHCYQYGYEILVNEIYA